MLQIVKRYILYNFMEIEALSHYLKKFRDIFKNGCQFKIILINIFKLFASLAKFN